MNTSLLILLGVLLVLLLIPVAIYNGLVSKRNAVENAFASLDANLQKRFDLVPNLVSAVKNYMKHERETLEEVTRLRAQALQNPNGKIENEGAVAGLMRQIVVAAENYPELKASENFSNLQRGMTEIEEQISASRRAFNAAVNDYNNAVETFPSSIFAGMFNFKRRQSFEVSEPAARQNVKIEGLF